MQNLDLCCYWDAAYCLIIFQKCTSFHAYQCCEAPTSTLTSSELFSISNLCWLIWSAISKRSCQNLAFHCPIEHSRSSVNSLHSTMWFLSFKTVRLSSVQQRSLGFSWQSSSALENACGSSSLSESVPGCARGAQPRGSSHYLSGLTGSNDWGLLAAFNLMLTASICQPSSRSASLPNKLKFRIYS